MDPAEIILRSVRRVDVNREKMQIKPGALKPGRSDRSALSLIRGRIGHAESRAAAIIHVHKSEFWGFGSTTAETLRGHCADLRDDREPFCGHATMDLGYEIPAGPPNTPPGMESAYENAMNRLIELAKVFVVGEEPGDVTDVGQLTSMCASQDEVVVSDALEK